MQSTTCPTCQNPIVDDGTLAGQLVKCPICCKPFVMPGGAVPPPPPKSILNPARDETFKDRLRLTWPGWAIATGLLGWLLCVTNEPGGRAILCYPFIALACAGATGLAVRRFDRWWISYAGTALAALVFIWWGSVDTYNERWRKDQTRFVDTYTRWGDTPVSRRFDVFDSEENAAKEFPFSSIILSGHGPMAGTGKRHGRWSYSFREPDYRYETRFYWYGEEISEGEWHLRNK